MKSTKDAINVKLVGSLNLSSDFGIACICKVLLRFASSSFRFSDSAFISLPSSQINLISKCSFLLHMNYYTKILTPNGFKLTSSDYLFS
jgi:hypothetical protein